MNLATTDVERFQYAGTFINYLWEAPLETLAILVLGLDQVGVSFLAGFAALALLVPLQVRTLLSCNVAVHFGSAWLGSVWLGSVQFGSVRFGSVRFGSVRFGSVRFGSVRFGSIRGDLAGFWLDRERPCTRVDNSLAVTSLL